MRKALPIRRRLRMCVSSTPLVRSKSKLLMPSPFGYNVRSAVATYSGIMDQLRKNYAATDTARAHGHSVFDFSYNTGSLACPRCEGTCQITLMCNFCLMSTSAAPTARAAATHPRLQSICAGTSPYPRCCNARCARPWSTPKTYPVCIAS